MKSMLQASVMVLVCSVPNTNTGLKCPYQYRYLFQNQCHHSTIIPRGGKVTKTQCYFHTELLFLKKGKLVMFQYYKRNIKYINARLMTDGKKGGVGGWTVIIHNG